MNRKYDPSRVDPRHEEPPRQRDDWPYWRDDERPHEAWRAAVQATIIALVVVALIIIAHFLVEVAFPEYSGV